MFKYLTIEICVDTAKTFELHAGRTRERGNDHHLARLGLNEAPTTLFARMALGRARDYPIETTQACDIFDLASLPLRVLCSSSTPGPNPTARTGIPGHLENRPLSP